MCVTDCEHTSRGDRGDWEKLGVAGHRQRGEGGLLNGRHVYSNPESSFGITRWASALRSRRKLRADPNLGIHHKTTGTPQKFQRGIF